MYYSLLLISFGIISAKCDPCCVLKTIDRGVSEADIELIVNKHNELRDLVMKGEIPGQPAAKHLKQMIWDEKLSIEAQIIADSCNYSHVRVNDSRWPVGQNLYRKKSTAFIADADWNHAIQSWFDEHKDYNHGNDRIKGTGHYTQVIWATTEFVGCGYVFFETNEHKRFQKLYVCNYGPSGNVVGMAPYEAYKWITDFELNGT